MFWWQKTIFLDDVGHVGQEGCQLVDFAACYWIKLIKSAPAKSFSEKVNIVDVGVWTASNTSNHTKDLLFVNHTNMACRIQTLTTVRRNHPAKTMFVRMTINEPTAKTLQMIWLTGQHSEMCGILPHSLIFTKHVDNEIEIAMIATWVVLLPITVLFLGDCFGAPSAF